MVREDDRITVLFVDDDADFLDLASRLLELESDNIDLLTESDPSNVDERLGSSGSDIDCVVSDYMMDTMDGIELLRTIRSEHPTLPFVLFTAKGDEEIASETISAGATDYVINTGSPEQYAVLANRIETIVGHQRSERIASQRRRIDSIYRNLSQAIIGEPTKDRIEQTVCDSLAAFEGYTLVWFGETSPDPGTAIEFRARAGDDIDTSELRSVGEHTDEELTEADAIDDETVQVVDDISHESEKGHVHPLTDDIEFRSMITVPIASGGISYGGLTIYSDVPGIFSGPEGEMLADLGELIGFAFVAAEQREGMFSYTVREIEFTVDDPSVDLIECAGALGSTVRLEGAVPRPDGQVVLFLRAGPDAPDPEGTAEVLKSIFDAVESRTLDTGDNTTQWSVAHSSWFGEQFTHHGVQLTEVTADPDSASVVLECPPSVDVRDVVELAQVQFEDLSVTAQRQRSRDESRPAADSSALTDLTNRQRDVLETAYRNGFFAWPRETTAEEVATILDISQPAFSRHIRRSEQKVFCRLFDGASETE